MHSITQLLLGPSDLTRLKASDYGHLPITGLRVEDVHSPGEPDSHMIRLMSDVRLRGICHPIIVRNVGDVYLLVDGHHRAVLAINLGITCPAIVVECNHPVEQVCPQVVSLCQKMHIVTQLEGWEWSPVLEIAR